jgi:hypothetical protein
LQQRLRFLAAFLAHQALDRHPVLEFRRLDDIEKRHAATRIAGPKGGETQGLLMLLGGVDHDKEDACPAAARRRCGTRA